MLMVGGGAVNFHGYQRHSADVDFWIETSQENLKKLLFILKEMGFEIEAIPQNVKNREQNISIKFSPLQTLELITAFNPNKSFDEAMKNSAEGSIAGFPVARYRVLGFDDLISSKIKAGRPKDLLDIMELKNRRKDSSS